MIGEWLLPLIAAMAVILVVCVLKIAFADYEE